MKSYKISLNHARQIILKSQLLEPGKNQRKRGKTLFEIIDQLGYLQIDTISVIKRAHHHVLWTRMKDYREKLLEQLQEQEKTIFEYWGHAMSYLPMKDYRFYLPKMKKFANPQSYWVKNHIKKSKEYLKPVLQKIKDQGPMSSKDFDSLDKTKGGSWWDWKPAKVALEFLFWRGDLMIAGRKKFQKYYDLRERVLPPDTDVRYPDDNELSVFFVMRALQAFGIANEKEIQKFLQSNVSRDSEIGIVSKKLINKAINDLISEGKVSQINIEDIDSNPYYSLSETLEKGCSKKHDLSGMHFLSPFDNLIIQRKRVRELFNFNYVLECYKPRSKREYGYFVLPVLYKNQLIGRLDPKADKKTQTLFVNNLVFEDSFKINDVFIDQLAEKLTEFGEFNGCRVIEIQNSSKSITDVLNAVLKKNRIFCLNSTS